MPTKKPKPRAIDNTREPNPLMVAMKKAGRIKATIKKKPTDSTMRNVRAANKRIKELEEDVEFLHQRFDVYRTIVEIKIEGLSKRVRKLEKPTAKGKRR